MDKDLAKTIIEAAKPIVEPVYTDVAKPIVKPTAELVGLIPRAIKSALLPLEKWIISREHNKNVFIELLEKELEDLLPENIQEPDAHIAVPLLQALNNCIDSDELRELYARLLAKSMYSENIGEVHPAYTKIIEQLCPDEAKILNYLHMTRNEDDGKAIKNYSNKSKMFIAQIVMGGQPYGIELSDLGLNAGCEKWYNILSYIDNLTRLGLITVEKSTSRIHQRIIIDNAELNKHLEVKLTLVVAAMISDDKMDWDDATECMRGSKIKYDCFSTGYFRTTNLFMDFANSAIEPIKKPISGEEGNK
ncbi:MAG: DUF4393 domain-containing protein [Oscillospiraceae bacterium]|nr:DUF4393 domain-containing protein [Oscillospiraceae bacterium]